MQNQWQGFPTVGELRGGLDTLTERIIFRLSDRRKFTLNYRVRESNGLPIEGRRDISFLEYALEGLETYHATLGRFDYPDQFPLTSAKLPASVTPREVLLPPLPIVGIDLRDRLLPFYLDSVLPQLTTGEDPETFGETAYLDAELLEIINMRINRGRYIAIDKARDNPQLWQVVEDHQRLSQLLQNREREEQVLERALGTAAVYSFDRAIAELVFRWIIKQTLALEVEYLQGVAHLYPDLTY